MAAARIRSGPFVVVSPEGEEAPAVGAVAEQLEASPVTAPLLLTAAEAAALCNVSERTWRAWDCAGHIPEPVRVGRSVFWRPRELSDWVDAGCPDRHTWNVMPE